MQTLKGFYQHNSPRGRGGGVIDPCYGIGCRWGLEPWKKIAEKSLKDVLVNANLKRLLSTQQPEGAGGGGGG